MFHLVYVSTATQPFSDGELLELLRKARARNARLDVSGLMLYKQGTFMQALEGEETAIRALYATICKDPRHDHILTLLAVPVTDRLFQGWSMGFQNLEGRDIKSIPGYDPNPDFPTFSDEFPWKASVAMRLLAGFKQTG